MSELWKKGEPILISDARIRLLERSQYGDEESFEYIVQQTLNDLLNYAQLPTDFDDYAQAFTYAGSLNEQELAFEEEIFGGQPHSPDDRVLAFAIGFRQIAGQLPHGVEWKFVETVARAIDQIPDSSEEEQTELERRFIENKKYIYEAFQQEFGSTLAKTIIGDNGMVKFVQLAAELQHDLEDVDRLDKMDFDSAPDMHAFLVSDAEQEAEEIGKDAGYIINYYDNAYANLFKRRTRKPRNPHVLELNKMNKKNLEAAYRFVRQREKSPKSFGLNDDCLYQMRVIFHKFVFDEVYLQMKKGNFQDSVTIIQRYASDDQKPLMLAHLENIFIRDMNNELEDTDPEDALMQFIEALRIREFPVPSVQRLKKLTDPVVFQIFYDRLRQSIQDWQTTLAEVDQLASDSIVAFGIKKVLARCFKLPEEQLVAEYAYRHNPEKTS